MVNASLHIAEPDSRRTRAADFRRGAERYRRSRGGANLRVWLLLAPMLAVAGCVSEDRSQGDTNAAAQIGSTIGAASGALYEAAIAEGRNPFAVEIEPSSWPRGNAPASFTDASEVSISLRTGVVKGTAWAFNNDGSVASYHGTDIGLVLDQKTYFLKVDHNQGLVFVPADITKIIPIAQKFCNEHSLTNMNPSQTPGADVVAEGRTLKLVEFCIPRGVVLPPTWQAGDRIPRGPNE